nr:hypothetical protein [Tanacetum cinerariifolium]
MVNLEFSDIHNMVAYLEKVEETDTARTLDNREIEITATIDRKVKIVTGASVRRHLKLADSNGLIVQGAGSTVLVKSHHTPTDAPLTSQPHFLPTLRIPIRQETEVPQPSSPPHTNVADEAASTGVDVRHGRAATTVTRLNAGQGTGNIDQTPTMTYDSPLPRVNTLRSDDDSMTLQELMVFYTTLSNKVESLEKDFKQTKKKYDDLEDSSKQGRKITAIDKDPSITLVQHDAKIQERNRHDMEVDTAELVYTASAAVTTASITVSTDSPTRVSTGDDINMAETLVYIRKSEAKDKGKGKIVESETIHLKTKLQQEQERLDLEVAMRLQAKIDKEERQRIAKQLRGYSFDEIKTLFETTMKRVKTFIPMETEVTRGVLELVADSSQAVVREAGGTKRVAEKELDHQSSKKQSSRRVITRRVTAVDNHSSRRRDEY